MITVHHTYENPESNIAVDTALLDCAETHDTGNLLRTWHPQSYFLVLGISNKSEIEAHEDRCKQDNIPIIKRNTGGGTVLQGPGCFNYSLILKISDYPQLDTIPNSNCFIMTQIKSALSTQIDNIKINGFTDLTINSLKFSGNAQRRRRHYVLFHGTILMDFNLKLISKYLKYPSKSPDYREKRSHENFLCNTHLKETDIKTALHATWNAKDAELHPEIAKVFKNMG